MTTELQTPSNQIDQLISILLTTLDETVFFSELSKFIGDKLGVSSLYVFKVNEDLSAELVSKDGRPAKTPRRLEKGEGPAGHVIRTKRAYFSNTTSRDPLFANFDNGNFSKEIIIPVSFEGIVIATIHLLNSDEGKDFHRNDITTVLDILAQLNRPLANIKMYLAAKYLNEVLLRKIEMKEQELAKKERGVHITDTYIIKERPIVGKSQVMKDLAKMSDKVAQTDANLLLEGESGTGKELFSRRIHCRSSRKDRAFVVLDCSSLSEMQADIELFGQEIENLAHGPKIKQGLLEVANGGTLILDDVCSLSPKLQSKILNFLKDGLTFRVGGQVPYRSNVRIMSLSNKKIEDLVAEGMFREDLFYALATVRLKVPALRERREDIEVLATYFLNRGKAVEQQKSFSPSVLRLFREYRWNGNVRELQNAVERAYILSEGPIVEEAHIPETIFEKEEEIKVCHTTNEFRQMTLDDLEKSHICATLEHLNGNKTKTAKSLGITVKTLYNKLHSYNMIMMKEA
ncbi:MAG: sigma-54-dependent Fis family transcriptional regulator [Halobacteriovoraceae bacterium]|nr:sigma-54-dependent Fis family transcriptional regulator [Halobacteriovoraceae bacterium]